MVNTNVSIILVSPQKGENIGFAARAMLNFGWEDLRIVSPRDGWPNSFAQATSAKAISVIEKAKIYSCFADSIADLHYVYVTTARNRDINKPVITSRDISKDISKQVCGGSRNIGIVFGPERSGVDNNVLAFCNKIVQIPVGYQFASLNLAMAVGILCYEVSKGQIQKIPQKDKSDKASQDCIDNLITRLDLMLNHTNFYQVEDKRKVMLQNLTSMIKRIENITTNDVNTIMGILSSLYQYRG